MNKVDPDTLQQVEQTLDVAGVRRFETYPAYKPSGVDWIGDIPNSWDIKKFGHITYMKGRIGWQGLKQSEFTQNIDDPFLITGMNFKDGSIKWEEVYHISEERYYEAPEIHLSESDVLITKDGTIGKLLYINEIPYPHKASLNSHLLVLRSKKGSYHQRFLYYQLQSHLFQHHIEITKTGTTFYGITQEAMGRYKILLPPLAEQQAIARFLDEQTRKIDKLIEAKRKLLELLKEKRQAIITHAVTKGINPDVKMKPSGIDWLGDIPEHWDVKQLRRVVNKFIDYRGRTPNKTDSGVPLITASAIKNGEIQHRLDPAYISTEDYEHWMSRGLPEKDDIVLTTEAPLGEVAVVKDVNLAFAQRVILFKINKKYMLSKFLFYYYLSDSGFSELNSRASGSTATGIRADRLKSSKVIVPQLDEQHEIIEYIDAKISSLKKPLKSIKQAIDTLQEYRTTLITAAVTGKIDVRGRPS